MAKLDEKKASKKAEKIDIGINVATIVLSTLKDVAKLSPIPGLSESAGLTLTIIQIVQQTRSNKDGFRILAEDSTELVYAIIHAHKGKVHPEDIPADLNGNLQQLHAYGHSDFLQKRRFEGIFIALLRANVDAGKIQDYREKLRQLMRMFGLQSDISLRETVHKLALQQEEIIKGLVGCQIPPAGGNSNAGADMEYIALRAVGGGFTRLVDSIQGNVQIEAISGDKIPNNMTNTISNTKWGSVMTNITLNTRKSATTYGSRTTGLVGYGIIEFSLVLCAALGLLVFRHWFQYC